MRAVWCHIVMIYGIGGGQPPFDFYCGYVGGHFFTTPIFQTYCTFIKSYVLICQTLLDKLLLQYNINYII